MSLQASSASRGIMRIFHGFVPWEKGQLPGKFLLIFYGVTASGGPDI
jgi:hypothetical protein